MSKVAVFGGTFDPIHTGHLNLALTASRECELDRLIFMPNYISPFKQNRDVTPGEIRCKMVEQILHYDPAFTISRYEIDNERPSYTFDTLSYFGNIYGDDLAFIIGFDSVLNIDTWYRGPELISRYHLITGRRPDYDDTEGYAKIEEYKKLYNAKITVLEIDPFRASSSQIRDDISAGRDVSSLIPPEIEEYIRVHGLYGL